MGGLPCYKEIIDQMHALDRQMQCTETSLTAAQLPGGNGFLPTDDDVKTYGELAKPLADFLASLAAQATPS